MVSFDSDDRSSCSWNDLRLMLELEARVSVDMSRERQLRSEHAR